MKNRIDIINQYLDNFVPQPQPSLQYTTPFTLLIATLLSAQCHDEQVNRVTPKLFQEAPTPEAMAQLSEEQIGNIIHPCGFFKVKAHYIRALSEILAQKYQGTVPNNFEQLEQLPGIGHKTASVVIGHAFGVPTFPVDTHIKRLALKWQLSPGPDVLTIEKNLKAIFPQPLWFKKHLQMISFGRKYCNHINCKSDHLCPICAILSKNISA